MSMVSAAQMKAARAILDWNQEDFATACGLSLNTIRNIESGNLSLRSATSNAIYRAIEDAGLELLNDDGIKRRDDLVKIYKGETGSARFFEDLLGDLSRGESEIAIAIDTPETSSWFFSEQNAVVLGRLNRPSTALAVKCLVSETPPPLFFPPAFEIRLAFRQNIARLPYVISRNQYAVIAHLDDSSPPYLVSFRIPRASRVHLANFRGAWADGQRSLLPEISRRRKDTRS